MSESEPRFRRRDPGDRRREILEAARRAFVRDSYAHASAAAIAADAGVTRGLVHHYFGGKRDLYLAVVRSLVERATTVVSTELDLPPERIVAANVESWLDFAAAHDSELRAIGGFAGAGADREVNELIEEAREALVARIVLNQTGVVDPPPALRLLVRSYMGLAETASRDWLEGRVDRDHVRVLLERTLPAMMREALPALLELDRDADS